MFLVGEKGIPGNIRVMLIKCSYCSTVFEAKRKILVRCPTCLSVEHVENIKEPI
jgi:Zn finger protein HypA/HybF involved in hydrogenase expression